MSRLMFAVTSLFITCYLGWLSWGIVAHALKVGICGNPMSYYVVWDMFCGWSAYDDRTHIIAQGASGQYYRVTEPWGAFQPFGHTDRIHYDVNNALLPKQIANILKYTAHEPIDRVIVTEEIWPKQYNMPPRLWDHYYQQPPDRVPYYHVRAVFTETGQQISAFPNWMTQQALNSVADNPRLRNEIQQAQSTYSTLFTPVTAGASSGALGSFTAGPVSTN
ncbi:MAG: hypothetical protein R3C19_20145 [Planctomycetaceae bacterium]